MDILPPTWSYYCLVIEHFLDENQALQGSYKIQYLWSAKEIYDSSPIEENSIVELKQMYLQCIKHFGKHTYWFSEAWFSLLK
jgi:hypothetical protein